MLSVPWQPKGDGVDSTAFVLPPDLGVKGRVKPPPGLSRVEEEEEENEQLEDLAPRNHWSKECPKGKGRMSALTEEEGQQEGKSRGMEPRC